MPRIPKTGGAGFNPIGNITTQFTGQYNGAGYSITGLFINRTSSDKIGLFGWIINGEVSNLGLGDVDITGRIAVGGLVGHNDGDIMNSYVTGSVTGDQTAGGLVGGNADGTISDSYATGSVTGELGVGGLVAWNDGGIITASYWNMETSGQATSGGGTGLTNAQMKTESSFNGFDFTETWSISEGLSYPFLQSNVQFPFPGFGTTPPVAGDGSAGAPYQIATLSNLYWLSQNRSQWNKYYLQTADIDVSDTRFWDDGDGGDPEGFTPVGDGGIRFTGHYDGDGHIITGLTINRPDEHTSGLFGVTDTSAVIKNIGLVDVDITGGTNTGALAGLTFNATTVSTSYATGSVSGDFQTGGLIGRLDNSTLNDSYSLVDVNGGDRTGGLVGYSEDFSVISRSYSAGGVSGVSNTGGLAGTNSATVNDSYWNTETSGQATSDGGTGLTTPQMKTGSSFSGFDFTGTWSINEGLTYPWLQSNIPTSLPGFGATPPATGDGSETSPYEIANLGNLYWLSQNSSEWDKYYLQTADIDASDTQNWDDGDGGEPEGFSPIGNEEAPFTGQYDGAGHTITGLTIDRGSTDRIGLFGNTSGAVIKNTGLIDVDITGNGYAGGLVGLNDNASSVSNTFCSGNVSGKMFNTGILVGRNYRGSTISRSWSSGNVEGDDQVGGLVGSNSTNGSIIANSYSTGNITGENRVGGLVGSNFTATILNSYSSGDVNGVGEVGGLTGVSFGTSLVENSYWNTETSGQALSASGTSLTTAQMKQQSSYFGWDFTSVWSIDQGNSYPYLQNNIPSQLPGINDEAAAESTTVILYNQSLQFDGSNQYASLGGDPVYISGLPQITIELWVKPAAFENVDRLLEKEDEWYLYLGSDDIRWTIHGDGANYVSSGALETNQWYHVAGTYDGSEYRLYINGELKGSQGYAGGIPNSSHPLTLAARRSGGGSASNFFTGTMDEIRIWNTARTAEEIRRHMYQQLAGGETGLAGYWKLSEGSESTIFDLSANETNGLLFNPTWSDDAHPYGTFITGSEGWRMMSSPVDGASYDALLTPLWTQGFTGSDSPSFGDPNVFTWDEASGDWTPLTDAANVPGAGTGFLVYVYDDQDYDQNPDGFPKTIRVDNTQNDGPVAPALSYNDDGVPDSVGWNLVGNPYGATIDWNAASGWSRTNLDASFYVWNAAAGEYQSHNGMEGTLPNSLIAPWQGFWVQANAVGPTLSLNDSVRSAGGVFLKKQPVPGIRFILEGSLLSSSALVMLSEQAEAGKDPLDAWKLQSLNRDRYLSLYTTTPEGQALDINALPSFAKASEGTPLEVTMNFEGSNLGGKYTLRWNPKDLPETWTQGVITLTDLYTDRIIALDQPGDYTFEVEPAKSKESGVQPPPNHSSESGLTGLAQASTLEQPRHGPIPTVLKGKSTNPRFLLTINPAGSPHRLAGIPEAVELAQNYPNPFNPETIIRYGVPEQSTVQLTVFDILGRKVATLLNEQKTPGRYQVNFDASRFASGLYLYRLKVGSNVLTKKMMLIK